MWLQTSQTTFSGSIYARPYRRQKSVGRCQVSDLWPYCELLASAWLLIGPWSLEHPWPCSDDGISFAYLVLPLWLLEVRLNVAMYDGLLGDLVFYLSSGSCQSETGSKRRWNAGNANARLKFVSEGVLTLNYTDGKVCHHNHLPRNTVINFVCAADGVGTGAPVFIDETDDCTYFVSWHTELACEHEVRMLTQPVGTLHCSVDLKITISAEPVSWNPDLRSYHSALKLTTHILPMTGTSNGSLSFRSPVW